MGSGGCRGLRCWSCELARVEMGTLGIVLLQAGGCIRS